MRFLTVILGLCVTQVIKGGELDFSTTSSLTCRKNCINN